MQFDSLTYLLFLFIVTLLFWTIHEKFHKPLLLLSSYVFYMSWLPAWGLVLATLTAANYLLGIRLAASVKRRRAIFLLLLFINLGILVFYKYTGFILENFLVLFAAPSVQGGFDSTTKIIAPLGISFIIFGFIHYGTDVYRGRSPVRNWIDLAIYASFFPALICGPIKRCETFIEQLASRPAFREHRFIRGLWLLTRGMFKKMVLADSLNDIVSAGFVDVAGLGCIGAWIVISAFGLQIYFDFSGYTDMARGSAWLMGYRLPENFHLPYFASSIADFWRRWHMTLSFWFRDYLYIPLGGSRCSRLRNHANLLITMTLVGLWHGATWTFVVWGIYHGVGLIIHREWKRFRQRWQPIGYSFTRHSLAVTSTFVFVLVGWVLFRSDTLSQAWTLFANLIGQGSAGLKGSLNTDHWITFFIIGLSYPIYLFAARWLFEEKHLEWIQKRFWLLRAGWAALMLLMILAFPGGKSSFIYFEF